MTPLHRLSVATLALASALAFPGAAQAEKADRAKPLNLVADSQGVFDLAKQAVVFTGSVIITKGTLVIKADRVEVHETPDGYYNAIATGSAGRPATFRQKRDNLDEYIDGEADRLEYNDKADVIRFINRAVVRRLRGGTPGDEITGNLITYDNTTEVFNVSSGVPAVAGASAAARSPTERVRAVLTPREGSPAAAEAASQAASNALRLKPSPALEEKP